MWVAIQTWFVNNDTLITWFSIGSIVVFIVGILSTPWMVSLIPENYFLSNKNKFIDENKPSLKELGFTQTILKMIWLIVRNVAGVVLIILGFLMLFLPGPGVVTMIVGSFLLSFKAKIRFEQWLIKKPGVLISINWLRSKNQQPPLTLDP